jgi:LCP family protein required for cell wall assembly
MSTDSAGGRVPGSEPDSTDGLLNSTAGDAHGRTEQNATDHDVRGHRRTRRVLIGLGATLLVLLLLAGTGAWYLTQRYAGNVERVGDVFAEIPASQRPAPAEPTEAGVEGDPVTFLLIGSDTRESRAEGEPPGARSDAIMLARVTADREHAQLISIPRDSWVEIPGHGMNKINASYAFGGPSLLIRTVEQLTGARIDHFVAIDFDGLIQVTDDLGGVEVVVAETTRNGPYTFHAGVNELNGEEARWYLGQRYHLPGGDFDRVRRQQQFMKAMLEKLISNDTFSDLGRLDAALRAVTDAVAVDDNLGNAAMLKLAYSLRDVEEDDIAYLTAPVLGTGTEGRSSVVYLDTVAAERMWEYLQSDSLAENADEFAEQALPDVPR